MNRIDCHNDLVTRARRYRLSREECARLEEHLSVCSSCRLARQVGEDFDATARMQPGDEMLLLSLADRIRRRQGGRFGSGRKRLAMTAAAVACALFAAAAGAYAYMEHRVAATPPVEADLTAERSPSPRQVELVANTAQRVPRVDAPAPVEAPVHTRSATRPLGHARGPAAGATRAASLFANANAERRQGHGDEAIALYGELERQYPASAEALASRVSLGRLLLARGALPEALARLTDYLAASPTGTLAPEALYGQARALEGLGRKAEERQSWERLLVTFPDSVYAAQAQRRLDDLR